MSMLQHSTRAWGSPSRYIQGRYELENMKTHTEVYGRRVFFLIDVFFFADYKKRFEALYAGSDSQIQCEQFGGQCTEEEILRCTGLRRQDHGHRQGRGRQLQHGGDHRPHHRLH